MADDISIVIGATLTNLTSGLTDAKSKIQDFAEAAAAAFAIHEIDDFVSKMAELGTHTESLAAQIGAPVEQIQEFGAMAVASGASAESFTNMMNRLAVGMQRGQVATSQQAAAAKALGINFQAFMAASPESKVYMLADAMHRFGDGATKTADVLMLAGRGAAQNIAFFDQGSAAIKAWQVALEQAGAVVGETMISQLAQLDRNLVLMNSTWAALGETVVAKLSPGITSLITAFTNLGTAFVNSARDGGVVAQGLNVINVWLETLSTSVTFFQRMWEATFDVISGVIKGIGTLVFDLGNLFKDVFFPSRWGDISAAWGTLQADLHARFVAIGADLVATFSKAKADVEKIWSNAPGLAPAGAGAAGPQAPGANLGAAAAGKEALKVADEQYKQAQAIANEAYAAFQITEGQKTAYLEAQLKIRENAEIAAGESAKVAHAKFLADYEKLEADETKKIMDDWKKVADKMASDISTALDQILTKQKSFSAAMGAMFGNMLKQMIADVIKLILEFTILNAVSGMRGGGGVSFAALGEKSGGLIGALMGGGLGGAGGATQAAATAANTAALAANTAALTGHAAVTTAQTAATAGQTVATTGQAVATGANTVAQSGTIAEWIANTSATIANTAATIGKAVFGAETGVWKVPSYQIGTPSVPFTGLALLHPGEMVIPAGPAEAIRAGASGIGGGLSVQLNLSAMDGASVASWLRSGGGNQISRYVMNAWQNNPSLRPGYSQ